MKIVITVVVFIVAVSISRGEAPVRSFSSLPPLVYFVSEPIEGGPAGRSSLYEIDREGRKLVAIFSSAAAAERFLGVLPDAKAHKRSSTALPKSFVRDLQEQRGAQYILDPDTSLEGGSLVSVNPAIPEQDQDNAELKLLSDADQADRSVANGRSIDWSVVAPRDAKRLARVEELYVQSKLNTATDYFNAALILQHGATPEDFLLAHELAVVALRKGYAGNAAWLVAASEDRFLQSIGRKQRFGTQLTDPIVVDGLVTDRMREEFGVPSLAEEIEQAKEFHKKDGRSQTLESTSAGDDSSVSRGSP